MIDTAMVIWTSGLWKRLLRTTGMLMLLFICICALSFLITTSRDKWDELLVSKAQPGASETDAPARPQASASDATATALPVPVPTARPAIMHYIIPVILQNPVPPEVHSHKHTIRIYQPTATRRSAPSNSAQDPSLNDLQNLP